MVFLGVDIGFDRCGFCILNFDEKANTTEIISAGSILTDKKHPISRRLQILAEDLNSLKKQYKPDFMCIKKLFFNRKNPTFEKVCMAKGIAMFLFADSEVLEIEPKSMKKEIIGNGNATKAEIRVVLETLLQKNMKGIYDDTIDAICLAFYQLNKVKYELLSKIR